jgi:tRNA-methyltransferase O
MSWTHLWLLTSLGGGQERDREPSEVRQVPFLAGPDGPDLGVFACGGPRRPNPVGLCLVEIVAVESTSIRFRGADMIHGIPILDSGYFQRAGLASGGVVLTTTTLPTYQVSARPRCRRGFIGADLAASGAGP